MPFQPPRPAEKPGTWGAVPPEVAHRRKGMIAGLQRFWQRVTEGLEIDQLWSQFKHDAHGLKSVVEDRAQLLEWSDGMMRALIGTPDGVEKATEAFIGYQAFATEAIAASVFSRAAFQL